MERYTFPSPTITNLIMDATDGVGAVDPTDLTDAITNTLRMPSGVRGAIEVYVSAPNDDDVCEIEAPFDVSPAQVERYVRAAIYLNI